MPTVSNPPLSVEALIKRSDAAWAAKASMLGLMRDAYDYAIPLRNAWRQAATGQVLTDKVYDSTAVTAVARFANRVQSVLFPPLMQWARLEPGPDLDDAAREQVAPGLEKLTKVLFRHIHAGGGMAASPFDVAINEMMQDLAAGTGILLIENARTLRPGADRLLRFQAIPSALIAFDEGPFGAIEGLFWKIKSPVRDLARRYPDGTIPADLQPQPDDPPDRSVDLLHGTYYDPDGDRWVCDVVWPDQKQRIVARGYRTNPLVAIRWAKAPGEVDGRGPLIEALPDIKTLNKIVELTLKNAAMAIAGMYTAEDDGVLNPSTIRLVPGAIIPVAQGSGGLKPLQTPARFDISNLMVEQLQTSIKRTLFDHQLPPDKGPVRSATEIVQRMQELQQDIGGAFGRLQIEGVQAILLRCLDILIEAGEAPPIKVDGREISLAAAGELARAQRLANVKVVADYLSFATPFGPSVLQAGIKPGEAAAYVAEEMGVPARLIPTAQDRQAAAKAEQDQRQAALVASSPVAAQVAGNLTKPKPAEGPLG